MFVLLPSVGVALPHRAGTLRFGMTEREAQWPISTLSDVREEWLCVRTRSTGVAWAFHATYGDLTISVCGGPSLDEVRFTRLGDPAPTTPGRVPVVWEDLDLFGYPADEVFSALAGLRPAGLTLGRHGPAYLDSASLARPERRRPVT
ncbi:hypothetical protein [Actinomadura sp. DC4]|uniref:hypothetical protein n=1 Tax=Actinomadura sp. DC4 TaxID=3055069 RepID=UPI0025B2371E|nr:hypothetical protein [Actinomadura sp. DC4]MDN3359503.1 hypothetical protein [Actinomadura sp. DC4]